ncbi:hypothetical protein ACSBR2_039830 [Camellia fascicularis]
MGGLIYENNINYTIIIKTTSNITTSILCNIKTGIGEEREDNMSFREESDDGRDLKKPFLHTGSWYRMGSRQSSMMSSSQAIRDRSISVLACVLIVALGTLGFAGMRSTAANWFAIARVSKTRRS